MITIKFKDLPLSGGLIEELDSLKEAEAMLSSYSFDDLQLVEKVYDDQENNYTFDLHIRLERL